MLIVYGPRAKEAARSLKSQLHWYALGTLPENCAAEEDAAIAPSFAQLAHRDVVIWPEPGDAGRERAHRHARMIAQSGVTSAGVVAPHALDLGQPLPADVTPLMQRAWADEARDAARALALPALAGRGVRAVAPWPAPPSLALLHAETCTFLRRYLSEPGHAIETMALWCLHAWAARRERSTVDASPRLVLRGLDPRAEHARALRLIAWLTPAPLIVSRTIASHLLSAIEADKPTLLLDDVAGGILYRRDLRSLIAAGAARDGIFLTARNKRNESGRGQCFAPAAIATAAPLPEDLRLRSIVLPMAPATAGGARAQLTLLDPPGEALELRAKMQAWASTAGDAPAAFSMLPHSISTAARENWAVLMDIALKVGPDAAKRTAEAAITLSASAPPAASNLALLRDIRELNVATADGRVASSELLAKLTADPERVWATAHHGRALTPRGLAERLANFGIRPRLVRHPDGKVSRGYLGTMLIEAFGRYLSDIAPSEDTLEASDALQETPL